MQNRWHYSTDRTTANAATIIRYHGNPLCRVCPERRNKKQWFKGSAILASSAFLPSTQSHRCRLSGDDGSQRPHGAVGEGAGDALLHRWQWPRTLFVIASSDLITSLISYSSHSHIIIILNIILPHRNNTLPIIMIINSACTSFAALRSASLAAYRPSLAATRSPLCPGLLYDWPSHAPILAYHKRLKTDVKETSQQQKRSHLKPDITSSLGPYLAQSGHCTPAVHYFQSNSTMLFC